MATTPSKRPALAERIQTAYDAYNDAHGQGEVEAFLSLYYLATFMQEALDVALPVLAELEEDAACKRIDGILNQDEEDR